MRQIKPILIITAILISTLLLTVRANAVAVPTLNDTVTVSTFSPEDPLGIQRLQDAIGGAAQISINKATGVASFVRLPVNRGLQIAGSRASAQAQVSAFFNEYGNLFGISHAQNELTLRNTATDALGMTHLSYQQVYQGVPVFGSGLNVHLGNDSAVVAVNGTFVPSVDVRVSPSLSAEAAAETAVNSVALENSIAAKISSSDISAVSTNLTVFRAGLLQAVAGSTHLAYEVEVANSVGTIRELIFVDAHSGKIIDRIGLIHTALDRRIYRRNLGTLAWQEGNSLPYKGANSADVNNLVNYAEDAYNLFSSMTGGSFLSWDGQDSTMHSIANYSEPGYCPNASWGGSHTQFCRDVTGDDTVAHEWGHAYTDSTHNLIYQWQSGALNESYSDIWGEMVDNLNGAGTDSPGGLRTAGSCSTFGNGSPSVDNSYRWLSGEDDGGFGGAIRDLWNPTCYGDPGKVTDTQYHCAESDGGGVHTNSGVPNHAYALLIDGGTYNGVTISALGNTKVAHIYWRAQTVYQGPATSFSEHADALEASCNDLVGASLYEVSTDNPNTGFSADVISATDCTEVADAMLAVEMRTEPTQCGFTTLLDPNAPALCSSGETFSSIDQTNWESGLGSWSVGTRNVANASTFDTPDWAVVSSLPDGQAGSAAFVEDNPAYGDCSADTEAGVLYLESGNILIPGGSSPRVAFDHWVATELGWDGGNVKISINGGSFSLIPGSAFDFNAYNSSLQTTGAGNDNPMAGEAAFTGTDGGVVNGTWGQSHIDLNGIAAAGDSIRLRFEMGLDGCSGVVGWYVDTVEVYSCTGTGDNPPTVNITNPNNNDTVSGNVSITATANDDNGVTQVEFFVDGGSIGVDTNGGDGWSATWDSTTVADGSHSISATATDTASQTGSDSINVTVSNVASPEMHLGNMMGSSAVTHPSGRWQATVTVTIHDSGHALLDGATVNGTWSNGSNGSGSCVTSGGQCDIVKNSIHKNNTSVTFTVTSMTHSSNVYNSGSNDVSNSIVVNKP